MINQEFLQLNQKTLQFTPNFSTALLPQNGVKNRYNDVMAVEHSRVKLAEEGVAEEMKCGDYINANFVNTADEMMFICTQSPTNETCIDFWQMVWDHNTTVICALNRLIENRIIKGILYWPETEIKLHYGPYTLELVSTFPMHQLNITLRIINLSYLSHPPRQIYHLHYEGWPDYGVPESSLPIRELVKLSAYYHRKSSGPMIVHCSAGIGRSGTFMAISSIMADPQFKKIIEQRLSSKSKSPSANDNRLHSPYRRADSEATISLMDSPLFYNALTPPYPRVAVRNQGRPIRRQLKPRLAPPISFSSPPPSTPTYQEDILNLLSSEFKIMDLVYSMRQQRNPGIVQTEAQYRFIYTALHDEILHPIIVSENVARIIMKFNPKKRRYRSRSQPVFKTPKKQKLDYHQTFMRKHTSNNLGHLMHSRKNSLFFEATLSSSSPRNGRMGLTSFSGKETSSTEDRALVQSGPIIL